MKPHAVQIVVANSDHTFSLDEEALTKVLLRDEIKDRYVVVVSVAGAFRHGKSFLLDFFLRYMNSKVTTVLFIKTFFNAFFFCISMCSSKTPHNGWEQKTHHWRVSHGGVGRKGTPQAS